MWCIKCSVNICFVFLKLSNYCKQFWTVSAVQRTLGSDRPILQSTVWISVDLVGYCIWPVQNGRKWIFYALKIQLALVCECAYGMQMCTWRWWWRIARCIADVHFPNVRTLVSLLSTRRYKHECGFLTY